LARLPAHAIKIGARLVGREIRNPHQVDARHAGNLREVHGSELAGTDEADANRVVGGGALEELSMEVHGDGAQADIAVSRISLPHVGVKGVSGDSGEFARHHTVSTAIGGSRQGSARRAYRPPGPARREARRPDGMESLIAAAGRALLAGNVLGALNLVALRDDPPALALRGIAMARLGDYARARDLLRRAARGFGPRESLARARCIVAQAEVALAMRDLRGSPRQLASAVAALDAHADRANAVQGQLVAVRRLLLLGRFDEAASLLATIDTSDAPPALIAVAEIAAAELALRCLRTSAAGAAIGRARQAAGRAGLPALLAEVTEASAALDRPAARRIRAGQEQLLRLDEVAALLATDALVVDACRHGLHCSAERRALARPPGLLAPLLA